MANWYVRDGAAGANNGTDWTNAWEDTTNINWASVSRGDTMYVADGNYAGEFTLNKAVSGSTYINIYKATITSHGTETGWSNAYGDGQAQFNGHVWFETGYWNFDGVTGGGPGNWIGATSPYGFYIYEPSDAQAVIRVGYAARSDYVRCRHIDMWGKGSATAQGGGFSNDGLAYYNGSDNITLSYCRMNDIARCPIFSSGGGILYFEYNYVQDFENSGDIHGELASFGNGTIHTTYIRYCLLADSQSTGGVMWCVDNDPSQILYFYGNVIYQPSGDTWASANGFLGSWSNTGTLYYNVNCHNNTWIGVVYPLGSAAWAWSNNYAYNNIFYNCGSPNWAQWTAHDYNHYINSGGLHSEANGTSAASGDPFADYINLLFTLTGATTAGKNDLGSPYNVDPLGVTRGADGTWDRGAYEYDAGGTDYTKILTGTQGITDYILARLMRNTTRSKSVTLAIS